MKTRTKIILFASSLLLLVGAHLIAPSVAYALPYGNETLGPDGQLTPSQPSYIPEQKYAIPEKDTLGDEKLSIYRWDNVESKFVTLEEFEPISVDDYYMIAGQEKYNDKYYYVPALSASCEAGEFSKENGVGMASASDLSTLTLADAGYKVSKFKDGYKLSSYNLDDHYLYHGEVTSLSSPKANPLKFFFAYK